MSNTNNNNININNNINNNNNESSSESHSHSHSHSHSNSVVSSNAIAVPVTSSILSIDQEQDQEQDVDIDDPKEPEDPIESDLDRINPILTTPTNSYLSNNIPNFLLRYSSSDNNNNTNTHSNDFMQYQSSLMQLPLGLNFTTGSIMHSSLEQALPQVVDDNTTTTALNHQIINSETFFDEEVDYIDDIDNPYSSYPDINYGNNIEEIFANLGYIINTEKEKIKQERDKLHQLKTQFTKTQKEFIKNYQHKVNTWKDAISVKNKSLYKDTDVIDIDIGGNCDITTTRGVLTKYPTSVLGICFIGEIKLPQRNGRYFLDRDASNFQMLLHYLRTSTFPSFTSQHDERNFFMELNYWKIPLRTNPIAFEFDKNWCAETLSIDKSAKILKKRNPQHGIVFVKPTMNAFNPYIEFKVVMNARCKIKSHLFLGLVDVSKYQKKFLTSTFWKDSPSAFYWDVWNHQLIVTDEHGTQVTTKKEYGCECEDFETKLAIRYDQEHRTVTYYKNDINLGVAFHNVQPNLTPALDVWFENGMITIMNSTGPEEKIYL